MAKPPQMSPIMVADDHAYRPPPQLKASRSMMTAGAKRANPMRSIALGRMGRTSLAGAFLRCSGTRRKRKATADTPPGGKKIHMPLEKKRQPC